MKRATTQGMAVEVQRLTKRFGGSRGVLALDDVSLGVEAGRFFTLLGPSGCGKTTLLRLIAGLERPDRGEILLSGQTVTNAPPYRRAVNTVFQSYALFPHLTVAANVAFGLEMRGVHPRERSTQVAEMLERVKLTTMANRRPAQLSGGQQQRVALARALVNRPEVLLLDEPLSALDLKLRKEMQGELKRLQRETGVTFIFVTHDQEEALTMSDAVAVMDEGKVVQVGTPAQIYEHPRTRFVADFIGESNFLSAVLEDFEDGDACFRLVRGGRLRAEASGAGARQLTPGETYTLAIRPERARLLPQGQGSLAATVVEGVYFGTDTRYDLALAGGGSFQVRRQNAPGAAEIFEGQGVSVAVDPAAVQILAD
ncbi:MAG: ABC transporter ATP-binding protein [Candidatus Competibacterales bacterium]